MVKCVLYFLMAVWLCWGNFKFGNCDLREKIQVEFRAVACIEINAVMGGAVHLVLGKMLRILDSFGWAI